MGGGGGPSGFMTAPQTQGPAQGNAPDALSALSAPTVSSKVLTAPPPKTQAPAPATAPAPDKK